MPKYIFVTGGVVSSLGKGIVAASIGLLFKSRGLRVAHQKLDPYLNINPGTMNPEEHGEVYITEDGAETDLDLGYYERFTGVQTHKNSSYSAGKIYDILLNRQKEGGGETVQVVPHLTNEIQNAIKSAANEDTDVVIVEIGGTVGDIEGLPFLEALRLFRQKEGWKNTYFVHCTLIPYLTKAREVKTKPTQHSVAELRRIGIIPNMLVCRVECEDHLDLKVREKLGLFCNVDTDSVLGSFDYKHTIYEVPISLANQNIDTQILDYFGLPYQDKQINEWLKYIENISAVKEKISFFLVGKHTRVPDAYKSIEEVLIHTGATLKVKVEVKMISAEKLESHGKGDMTKAENLLKDADGILVPDGFKQKGTEGKVAAIKFARENNVPFFGICLGMQMAVEEFARSVLDNENANEAQSMASLMNAQKKIVDKGGTLCLGAHSGKLKTGTLAAKLYGKEDICERYRRLYEINGEYRDILEKKGMVFSGVCPDGQFVEIVELPEHPYFIGVQFHPEFKSSPVKPHPLFIGLVKAAIKKNRDRLN